MTRQIKHIVRMAVVVFAGLLFVTSSSGCAAQKCDCPTFGGHRLKH